MRPPDRFRGSAIVGIGIFLAAMAGHGSEVVIVSVMLAAFAWGIGYGCRSVLA
jgi:hypothetical protein